MPCLAGTSDDALAMAMFKHEAPYECELLSTWCSAAVYKQSIFGLKDLCSLILNYRRTAESSSSSPTGAYFYVVSRRIHSSANSFAALHTHKSKKHRMSPVGRTSCSPLGHPNALRKPVSESILTACVSQCSSHMRPQNGKLSSREVSEFMQQCSPDTEQRARHRAYVMFAGFGPTVVVPPLDPLPQTSMKRRVTVHFGDVRVVVPCQDENTTVADLAEAAIIRYKKATGKYERGVVSKLSEGVMNGVNTQAWIGHHRRARFVRFRHLVVLERPGFSVPARLRMCAWMFGELEDVVATSAMTQTSW
ncbi:hypothetical protein ANCCEY_00606 [Ancylostoma ceylanicum]|uniref:Par3/HAL N-terminal domain-containing protein n=1 Tax=Ancylostoma ceylanicum TaxID=53326 RepID=A0A0D6M889_9BILA|nr:hypothetical protein ANCCEY_00606 [Ancylostoma ceylanicum]